MKTKIIPLLFFAGLGIVVFVTAYFLNTSRQNTDIRSKAAPASSLSFDPSSVSVGPNETRTLSVRLNPGTNIVTAVELTILFDPAKLSLDNIINTSQFSAVLQAVQIDNTAGRATMTVGAPPLTPVTTSSPVATVTIRAKTILSTTTVSFGSDTKAAALNETANVITSLLSSTITIVAPTSTPTPTLTPTHTPTPTPTPAFLSGDIDRNGNVDIFDYNLLVTDFGKTGSFSADIDKNGRVDIFDYNLLVTNFGHVSS